MERFNTYVLPLFQELDTPLERVLSVPGLAIHIASKCNICVKTSGIPYFTLWSDGIGNHMIVHKLRIIQWLQRYQACSLSIGSASNLTEHVITPLSVRGYLPSCTMTLGFTDITTWQTAR
jgi:hypothetical protein